MTFRRLNTGAKHEFDTLFLLLYTLDIMYLTDLRTQQQRAASNHFLEQMESPVYNQIPTDGQKLVYHCGPVVHYN